jgi:hypothetical protein
MINIYEGIKEGQTIQNDHNGNQYEILKISENYFVTLLRGNRKLETTIDEINNYYSFVSLDVY